MKRWFFLAALTGAVFSACPPDPKPDGGAAYEHCLDSPVERPPGSELPCELLPPGFKR